MNYLGDNPMNHSGATFSACQRYRYTLWRWWSMEPMDPARMVAFVGLNPSTADASVDDPTIRRCINFAKAWGYDGMVMLNLFAWRDTDPKGMKAASNPIGEDNGGAIIMVCQAVATVVLCWGVHGEFLGRGYRVQQMLTKVRECHCFGLTKEGHPKHPLYLANNTQLEAVRGTVGQGAGVGERGTGGS